MFPIGKAIVIDGKREKMRSKDSLESFLTQIKNLHNVKDSIIHKTIVIVYIYSLAVVLTIYTKLCMVPYTKISSLNNLSN